MKTKELSKPIMSAMLTIGNVSKIADLLLSLLRGKNCFVVKVDQEERYIPTVSFDQFLVSGDNITEKAISVSYPKGDVAVLEIKFSSITWKITTKLSKDVYDPSFRSPYFIIYSNRFLICTCSDGKLVNYSVYIVGENTDDILRSSSIKEGILKIAPSN